MCYLFSCDVRIKGGVYYGSKFNASFKCRLVDLIFFLVFLIHLSLLVFSLSFGGKVYPLWFHPTYINNPYGLNIILRFTRAGEIC